MGALGIMGAALLGQVPGTDGGALDFTVRVETATRYGGRDFLWYHPRVAAIPGGTGDGPSVLMALQKHLIASDHYSGLYTMSSQGGVEWQGPIAIPEIDWVHEAGGVDVAVADVTPGWHAPTGKLLAVGAQVRYNARGDQLEDVPRAHQTAYAVFDPATSRWTPWRTLAMPGDPRLNFARSACAQWLTLADGSILLPFYFGPSAEQPYSVTVVRCAFDGDELTYIEHGNEVSLTQGVVRGLCEPSIASFGGRYYLTIRNDLRGYVTVSDDGLHYAPIRPWTFDDSEDLGSYNTQQHWLAHSEGLFLVYTRRGANNDHIIRHRAPLFIAQVDPERLCVLRATERVLIPERGAEMGNFGAAAVSSNESWVTVGEGMWSEDAWTRGGEGAVLVARVIWSKPNRLFAAP